jgi:uncharacterized protein (DUF39 family)
MAKTYHEINEKIRKRQAVVVTADEILELADKNGISKTAQDVDVVTPGTFGPMCSSGAFINFGHCKPRIRATRVWLNDVEAYAGLAAVDCYIGATQRQNGFSGSGPDTHSRYGGGHVIHDLVSGCSIHLRAESDGSDCYPGRFVEKDITLDTVPDAFLFCPRNGYQNYNCAVNSSDRVMHTYMGVLRPHLSNATYSGAGQVSPLMNDPYFKTIGIGTRIFLGGGVGYVSGPGTQHNPCVPRTEKGIPRRPAGTLAVTGDLKHMSGNWLRGTRFKGYGISLRVGLGIPIPILDEAMLGYTMIRDEDILVSVVDYGQDYPESTGRIIGEVRYADINSGTIRINGRDIPTSQLSDRRAARRIADILKTWIAEGNFLLGQPVELLRSE